MIQHTILFISSLLISLNSGFAQEKKQDKNSADEVVWKSLNKSASNIIDDEDIFTPEQELKLLEVINNYKKNRGIEFVIISISDLEKFKALGLSDVHKWENESAKATGVMLAISKGLHRMRIQNGDVVKIKVSDAATRLIIDAFCVPKFQKDDYYQGVLDGMAEIVRRAR